MLEHGGFTAGHVCHCDLFWSQVEDFRGMLHTGSSDSSLDNIQVRNVELDNHVTHNAGSHGLNVSPHNESYISHHGTG